MNSIERVKQNEEYLNEALSAVSALISALGAYASAKPKIEKLRRYYNTDWLSDVKADSEGLFPPELKRGVLSEDAIFDLLTSETAARSMAAELLSKD